MSKVYDVIEEKKEFRKRYSTYVAELRRRSKKEKLEELSKFRNFSLHGVESSGIFYIGDKTEMLLPDYIDEVIDFGIISNVNYKPIFSNRWVIPILDVDGEVQNLVGYSPEADERYVYGTATYYRRRDTMYGLENLKLAYELGYGILTEGITDAIRLRDMGYRNSFSTCGTHSSIEIMAQLNRCRYGIIKIPDRDNPGLKAVNNWKTYRGITLKVATQYKDVDEMCKEGVENQEWFKSYLDGCIDWILQSRHMGMECVNEEVTVL